METSEHGFNDHDILIHLQTDICWIKKVLNNHLRHHWAVELLMLAAIIGLIVDRIL